MTEDIFIRAMKISDIPQIMELEKQLFSSPWSREMFLEEIKSGFAFVLMHDISNKLLGYICGLLIYDEFNITNVAVAADFQKQGYAKLMLKYVISRLLQQNCFKFFLEVRESNLSAIGLYEKFGFKLLGKRKKYYNQPVEDALMMGLNFLPHFEGEGA